MNNPQSKPPLARVAAKAKKDENYLRNLRRNYALRKDVYEVIHSIDKLHDTFKTFHSRGAL